MNTTTIGNVLDRLEEDGIVDVRADPDSNRRGQFLAGWHNHSERRRTYVGRTLQKLTWHNLGWRLALLHNDPAGIDNDEIRNLFSAAENLWSTRRR